MSSFGDRRRLLRGLADGLAGPPAAAGTAADKALAAHLAAARRLVPVLCERPAAPAALDSPAFYAAIFDAAIRTSARALGGAVLRAAATAPVPPGPAEVEWLPVADDAAVAGILRAGVTRPRAPGWLWTRIRQSEDRRRRPARRVRPGATVLLAAALAVVATMFFGRPRGTPPPPRFVFETVDEPFTDSIHPTDFLRRVVTTER